MSESPAIWLRELGAVRPMATAASSVLVLGDICDGRYPVRWSRMTLSYRDVPKSRDVAMPVDTWHVFGVPCEPLTKDDCERILKATKYSGSSTL